MIRKVVQSESTEGIETSRVKTSKRVALIVTTIASFSWPFMGAAISIALPSIEREFKIDAVLLSWIAIAFTLTTATLLVPFGRMADIYGRKKVFTYGIVFYTVGSFFSAIATSVPMLIACRVLQGIGGAMSFGTSVAIITSVYPPGERGKPMGIVIGAVYLGVSCGPLIGGFLTQYFGWRSIFVANIPFGVLVLGLVLLKLKGEWAESRGERFDLGGSVICSVALVALIVGLTLLPALNGWLAIMLSLLGFYLFARWESGSKNPVVNLALFRNNRVFALSNIAALIHYSATNAVTFMLSLYLQYVRGMSPQSAGLLLVAQPIVQAVVAIWAGRLSDRIQPRLVASTGMAITAVCLLLLSVMDEKTSPYAIVAKLAFLGFGFGLFSSPNTIAVMNSVETKSYGIASGILSTMRAVGQATSMAIAVLLIALYVGRVRINPEHFPFFLKSIRVTFLICGTLCVGGVFASIARGKTR
jgi:EmrB/QacA subfamily drug resistance transporter